MGAAISSLTALVTSVRQRPWRPGKAAEFLNSYRTWRYRKIGAPGTALVGAPGVRVMTLPPVSVVTLSRRQVAADPVPNDQGVRISAIARAADYVSGRAHGAAVSAAAKLHGKAVSAAARLKQHSSNAGGNGRTGLI